MKFKNIFLSKVRSSTGITKKKTSDRFYLTKLLIRNIVRSNMDFSNFTVTENHNLMKKSKAGFSCPKETDILLTDDELRKIITKSVDSILDELKKSLAIDIDKAIKKRDLKKSDNEKIRSELLDDFKNTFYDYTKRDAIFKMPSNVFNLASSQLRGISNLIKEKYVTELEKRNRNKIKGIKKIWKHNTILTKSEKHKEHIKFDGMKIDKNAKFNFGGLVFLSHPHDQDAPSEHLENCNCEAFYVIES